MERKTRWNRACTMTVLFAIALPITPVASAGEHGAADADDSYAMGDLFAPPPCDPESFCSKCVLTWVAACATEGQSAEAECEITHKMCRCSGRCRGAGSTEMIL